MSDVRRYALAPDAILNLSADEAIILKLNDETMFSLNGTGARIAQLIIDGLTVAAIVDTLAADYKVSASDVEPDVASLLNQLVSGGLIVAVADGDSGER